MLFAEREHHRARTCLYGAVARPIGRDSSVCRMDGRNCGQQAIEPDLHACRERERGRHWRNRSRFIGRHVRDGARFWSHGDGSRPARPYQSARRFRRHTKGVRQSLEGLAREAQRRHTTEVTKPAVSHQCRGVAHARIQTRGRRDHCQPVDPVGLLKARRRSGRLSLGVAARPRGDRRRLHRDGCARARQTRVAIPPGDARTGRPLVAEHVARRHAVLARHPDGRNGPPHSPGGSRRSSRRHRHAAGETRCGRWCGERRHFSRAMVP